MDVHEYYDKVFQLLGEAKTRKSVKGDPEVDRVLHQIYLDKQFKDEFLKLTTKFSESV